MHEIGTGAEACPPDLGSLTCVLTGSGIEEHSFRFWIGLRRSPMTNVTTSSVCIPDATKFKTFTALKSPEVPNERLNKYVLVERIVSGFVPC